MSELDSKLPPVPQLVSPLRDFSLLSKEKNLKAENLRFDASWLQWFVQLKLKVDVIDATVVSLSTITTTGTGFSVVNAGGQWVTRTIQGTAGKLVVTNGNGLLGNPVIDFAPGMAVVEPATVVGHVATWSSSLGRYVGVAPSGGGVSSVSGTAPIVSSGGSTPSISITPATPAAAGSFSAADKTKLDGVATGATANATDAALRDRATHTGTQAPATISFSATDRLLGRATAGAGTGEEIVLTAAGRALIDDADATAQRATLGLGTIATQAATAVAITGGSITGITDLAVADGGTGASTAQAAINTLTAVATATNEHVLTRDTATGNAIFKAATGGGGGSAVPVQDEGVQVVAVPTAINFVGAGVTATNVSGVATVTIPGGSGGGGLGGVATITPNVQRGVFEWRETVAATGVTPSSRVIVALAGVDDSAENDPEMLDILGLAAIPLTGQIAVVAAFGTPTSGPISLNWSAF